MKRWLFIIGIIIILALIAIWVFLLFASNETKQDIYNRFGFTGEEEGGIVDDIIDVVLPDLEPEKVPLRQLTTKRVAGYSEIALASSSPQIYFSEAGTGHIYSLNLQNGVEAKISNITVAGAREAHIAKDGSFAAIRAGEGVSMPLTIVIFEDGTTKSITIEDEVVDFTITESNQLLYSIQSANGIVGRTYDIESQTAKTLFTVPFRQATILWGNHSEASHYVLPKTARSLEGYLYELNDGSILRAPASGYGLSALVNESYMLIARGDNDTYQSFVQNIGSGAPIQLGSIFFPEKCTISSQNIAYCGRDLAIQNGAFPDNWYRGEVSYVDKIWSIDLTTLEERQLLDTLSVAGRELDIIDPSLSNDEFSLYFKNKNDHTLWVYDIVDTLNQ